MRLTRSYRFSASHRLHAPSLSPDENRRLYGKCNNPHGHGHNYTFDITVEGPLDASGQIVDRDSLDRLVREQVLDALDHKDLNKDVSRFEEAVPTTENLASLIETMLLNHWNLKPRLAHIRISETDRNTFDLEAAR